MLTHGLARLRRAHRRCAAAVRTRARAWTGPRAGAIVTDLATDLVRRRRDLLLENALLRQHVIVISRTAKGPTFTPWDRAVLVLLARRLHAWVGGS